MNAREERSHESFKNSVGHVRHKKLHQQSNLLANSCTELEQHIEALTTLHGEVKRLRLAAKKEASVKRWRDHLRRAHLLPLKYTAWAKLKIKLQVPHKEARSDVLVAAGHAFEEALRPHLAVLTKAGFEDDCLEALLAAANHLKRWTTETTGAKLELKETRALERQTLSDARAALDMMHGAMLRLIRLDPSLEEGWLDACKLPGRIGHARESGGHLKNRPAKSEDPLHGVPTPFEPGSSATVRESAEGDESAPPAG